jgi:transposase
MSINITVNILGLSGQIVNEVALNKEHKTAHILCRRDKRRKAIDPLTRKQGTINRYIQRQVKDIPLFGYPCYVNIELSQVYISKNERRIEQCDFVDKGCRFTQRYCYLISGLCRHLSIQAVARHLGLRWESTKNIDKAYLHKTLPDLDPTQLKDLKYIGVDEVARAKGHDYMTVVYDMVEGHLIWVGTGRTSDVLSSFLIQLPTETASGIEAVAMDMGLSYQKSVRESLPNADIVFDRFHVMKNYSDVIKNQRRIEFRKAHKTGRDLMKGCHYLLLKNSDKLTEKQSSKLNNLLDENQNLNILYLMKEQIQTLWSQPDFETMERELEQWCTMADQTKMTYLHKLSRSLRKHKKGICNYAKYRLTSARIEAANVSIGMIRKRARGIK